jgi:hypothetical protein
MSNDFKITYVSTIACLSIQNRQNPHFLWAVLKDEDFDHKE